MRKYSCAKSRAVSSTPMSESSGSVRRNPISASGMPMTSPSQSRLHGRVGGRSLLACSEEASDGRGRAEREEDAQRVAGRQHRGGGRDAGELGCAEVADDRGVGEDVERLGDQREERRDRQGEDLAVEGVAALSAPSRLHRRLAAWRTR